MGTVGDGAKGEIRSPICPFCEEEWDNEHDKNERNECEKGECKKNVSCGWGNIGLGSYLGSRIAQARGKSKRQYKKDYLLAYKNTNIEAHHLICSEALNDQNEEWTNICFLTGYNINCFRNGVNLPSLLQVACMAKVPLHKGNHDNGYGGDSMYPDAVKAEIQSILSNYLNEPPTCKDMDRKKQFIEEMNAKSKEIFDHIKDFEWTVTWDGFDYQPGNLIGCSNQTCIADKKGTGKDKLKDENGNIIKNEEGKPILVPRSYTSEQSDNQRILTKLREDRMSIEKIEKDRDEKIKIYHENILKNENIQCKCGRTHPELNIDLNKFILELGK